MQIGDLVKFKNNNMVGLIIDIWSIASCVWYKISWADGHIGNRTADDLEVINGVS